MSLRSLFLRVLLALFVLNATGLLYCGEQLAYGAGHESELATVVASDADCAKNLAECRIHCQGHCAQHFNVLTSEALPSLPVSPGHAALPGAGTRAPDDIASSLFRPPRTASL